MKWKRSTRILLYVALGSAGIVLVCWCLPWWVVFEGQQPAKQGAVLPIPDSDGTPRELTLWHAKPLVPLPFLDTPHTYLRCGDKGQKSYNFGNTAGACPGDVLVSPDHKQAIVEKRYQGSLVGGVLIDLKTGEMSDLNRDDCENRFDWERLEWLWDLWERG